jgi:hypothetical protein
VEGGTWRDVVYTAENNQFKTLEASPLHYTRTGKRRGDEKKAGEGSPRVVGI